MSHDLPRVCCALTMLATSSMACEVIPNPALLGADGHELGEGGSTSETGEPMETGTESEIGDEASTESETGGCADGTQGCPCAEDGDCDEGLECVNGLCAHLRECGNGVVADGEACDDANRKSADGCEIDCTLTELAGVAAGSEHTCVLTELGDVVCFGANTFGQLGYGSTEDIGDDETAKAYGAVPLPAPAVALALGSHHTCAILEPGDVQCWGGNAYGQLGRGDTLAYGDEPDELAGLEPIGLGESVVEIAAGSRFTCVKTRGGDLHCWGQNDYGQLGHGDTLMIGDDEPVSADNSQVLLDASVDDISAGFNHTCALLSGGGVRCWGAGAYGQLGYNATDNVGDDEVPNELGPLFPDVALGDLAVGGLYTIVLYPGDSVYVLGWGYNNYGQLGTVSTQSYGNGVGPPYASFMLIPEPVAIASGGHHTCALLEGGTVRCWGRGADGQLGYGDAANVGDNEFVVDYPALVFPAQAVELAAGVRHSCALLADGALYCWGNNSRGAIGHPSVDAIGDDEPADALGPVPLFD